MKKLVLAALLFLVAACQADEVGDTLPQAGDTGQSPSAESMDPSASTVYVKPVAEGALVITPENPYRDTVLKLSSDGLDLKSAKIEWIVNKGTVPAPNPYSLKLGEHDVLRGSTVMARVEINGRSITSNAVTVVNTPPRVDGLRFLPEEFSTGDMLEIDAQVSDPDDDDVSIEISWELNGEVVSTERSIGRKIRRGDRVTVTVRPYDGETYGDNKMLAFGVNNAPPEIFPHNDFAFDGKSLRYEVWAGDEDDDPLTFSLAAGPEGMRLDPRTGIIQWRVPDDFLGSLTFSVTVEDGRGGRASYDIDLSIMGE